MPRLFRVLALSLLFGVLTARPQNVPQPRFVRASGEATINVKPDRALINIAVVTQSSDPAKGAQIAAAQNATNTAQVLAAVRQVLGSHGEVKTAAYSISPQYQYGNDHPPRLAGYEANNTVLVTVDDLSALGKIIDTATNSGANSIQGVSFTLKDDTQVRREALGRASAAARANADAIAKALNLQVAGVLQAEPGEAYVRPVMQAMAGGVIGGVLGSVRAATPTPVDAGDLDVHATVTVTLEIR